jgi:hypothetical protein
VRPDQGLSVIPAQLHYCWFGGATEQRRALRAGWQSLHPDAQIVRWDESNAPLEHPYLAAVLRRRCYSKAADFMRLWVAIHHGGIYLDTDVECVRSLEPLRTRAFFVGFQRESGFDQLECVNSAVLGATRGHWAAVELMERLLDHDDGSRPPMESGPRLISRFLVELGLQYSDDEVRISRPGRDPLHVLPRRAFYPYSWLEPPDRTRIGPDTFVVHHWDGSWVADWQAARASTAALSRRDGS